MKEQLRSELEKAAQILMAPPNLVSPAERQAADAVFMNFQKIKSPIEICQFILTTTQSDYVQFQAASLIKNTIIREKRTFMLEQEESQTQQLQNGLMNFVIQNTSIQNYVREQLLVAVVILIKLTMGIEDVSKLTNFILEVSQLISCGNTLMQFIGYSTFSVLLNEFSSSIYSTDIGMSIEMHLSLSRRFQTGPMNQIFQFCLGSLNDFLNANANPSVPENAKLYKKLLMIFETILSWRFTNNIYDTLNKNLLKDGLRQFVTLKPTPEWKSVFLDPNLIAFFFKLHWQVRQIPDLCHHSLQCLHQLSSLYGGEMGKDERSSYFKWFIENLLQFFTQCPPNEHEAISMSNTIRQLHLFFTAATEAIPQNVLQCYLNRLASCICYIAKEASTEVEDEKPYEEAYEHITEAWALIFQDIESYPMQTIKECTIEIFNQYVRCHLSHPDGIRQMGTGTEEIGEIEEDDRVKYFGELSTIGAFGRFILEHSIPSLVKLLEDRTARLHDLLQQIHQNSTPDNIALENLHEDLHWILMISAHVLISTFREKESCDPLIPIEIIRFCTSQAKETDINTTLQVLKSPAHKTLDIQNLLLNMTMQGGVGAVDPVVQLIAGVFRLCELEKNAVEASLTHLLSPETGTTLVWFLGVFSDTYLQPKEEKYDEMSLVLTQAFGRDSDSGMWTLDFVVGKLESNLNFWKSETKLTTETTKTLVTLVNNEQRGTKVLQCPSFLNILKKQSIGAYQLLPTTAKRSLLQVLVMVGTVNQNPDLNAKYWVELLKPLRDRYRALVLDPSFLQTYQTKETMTQVLDLIECFTGVVDGCTTDNRSHLMPFLLPLFEDLVKLLDLYHNYGEVVVLILQLFQNATCKVVTLDKEENQIIHQSYINLFNTYAKHNKGKIGKEISAEEEYYQDLLLILKIVNDLYFREVLESFFEKEVVLKLTVFDVIKVAFSILSNMVTPDLYLFPTICSTYFTFITSVFKRNEHELLKLPEEHMKNLFRSIEIGLTYCPTEISHQCLEFLKGVVMFIEKENLRNTVLSTTLEPFLKIIFNMIVLQPLSSDLTRAAGFALYAFYTCYQENFKMLVQDFMNSQSDRVVAERLDTSFSSLCKSMSNERMSFHAHRKLNDDIERFANDVRGYLCVK